MVLVGTRITGSCAKRTRNGVERIVVMEEIGYMLGIAVGTLIRVAFPIAVVVLVIWLIKRRRKK